jgi:outer membrane lipoprotein SlyB
VVLGLVVALAGCGPDYSPDTYSSTAVQQANKVEQGVVIGVRRVDVSASATVGTVTGAAAGGIAGSQAPGGSVGSAFGALGGSVIGGLVGTTVEHTAGDTTAFEYIVRKSNGDLLSVTQKDTVSLAVGQKVLVISGNQARIIPDYTVDVPKVDAADKPLPPAGTAPVAPVTAEPVPPPAEPPPAGSSPATTDTAAPPAPAPSAAGP